jgi:hypothetical protein
MFYVIEVVVDPEGKLFFCYNGTLRFDMFPAHLLARENDQDMPIMQHDEKKLLLRFLDVGKDRPEWMFEYQSTAGPVQISVLYAHQFQKGDSFSFFARPEHIGVGSHFSAIVYDCYVRHHVSLMIKRDGWAKFDRLGSAEQRKVRQRYRGEIERESQLLVNGPFVFPDHLPALALQ